jgi:2',3'-cyclic-nucleotide 2'-phosphodiesterase (5'-nucleotidase family)
MTTSIKLSPIGRYTTGIFDEGAAEIPAYDPTSQRLFVVNAEDVTVDVLDLSEPSNPTKLFAIDASAFGGSANSVAIKNGIVAIAIENDNTQEPGKVVFTDTDGNFLNAVTVGALPDMLTFTPDGKKVLVANEGEPNDDYTIDPEGSVSIIDISSGVENLTDDNITTADFKAFNHQLHELKNAGVRIFGPNASVAEDLEPEYITISPDSQTAWVALQENNALAVVDIESGTVNDILPLGFKDHNLYASSLQTYEFSGDNIVGSGLTNKNLVDPKSHAFDASDRDEEINIRNWPVKGIYQPDAIANFAIAGENYIITANEGDSRDYDAFSEEVRVKDLTLDPEAFPDAEALQADAALGRLLVTNTLGDTDGDGDFDELYSFGGRSFAIWDSQGNLVYDSGDEFERITAQLLPKDFNSNNDSNNSFDSRSDDKGPEPEGVVTGVIGDRTYAFLGLERVGGVMVYDITQPTHPSFVQYINPRDFSVEFDVDEEGDPTPTPEQLAAVGDLGPEGLTFISAEDSPNGQPLLVVANEVSGSTTVYEVKIPAPSTSAFTLQLLHAADQEAGVPALEDAPNFSAVLNALKNQDADSDGNPDYPNTLVLSSGDAYIPSPFFFASETAFGGQGRGDILIQNELGFDAIAFGNHEFDLGTGTVADLIQADEDYPGTNFPYLSANLDFSTDEDLAALVTEDGQEASEIPNSIAGNTIITVNGEKIGVVGATTPTLRTISSPGGVTVLPEDFDDSDPADVAALAAEIQTSVDELLTNNPEINKVVLLAHMQQISIEQQLAELLTGVDIIVAGGSNTLLADESDRLRVGDEVEGPYPILQTAADGNPVAVVNTDGNYKYVGRLVVDFDENGVIIPDSVDPNISGAYATDQEGVVAVDGTPDPEIVEITDALEEVIVAQDGNIFGKTSVFLNGTRGDVRTQETNLGNLTADANLAVAQQIDPDAVISIKNGGGIRDNIGVFTFPPGSTNPEDAIKAPTEANPVSGKQEGDISQLDIANALRFNNELTLVTLTAEELLGVIEHGVAATEEGATPGRFPQVSGLAFSFDPDLPAGDRVQSLAVQDQEGNILDVVVENGELVGDATRTFRTVTLNFLANGGDGYTFPDTERLDLVTEDTDNPDPSTRTGAATFAPDYSEQDAFAEYLAANFSEVPFDLEDVSPEEDTRIQNLDFRTDTVLENSSSGNGNTSEENIIFDDGAGNALIIGNDSNNELIGTEGNDLLWAGAGDDSLRGGLGNDILFGGSDRDTFVLAEGEGSDTIVDFNISEDFIGLTGGLSFGQISITQSGNNTVIGIENETLAVLNGVNANLLQQSAFTIV